MKHLFFFISAVLLCGCSGVYTIKPVGEKPKDLTHEVADWEGVWFNGDGDTFKVKVDDPVRGVLQLASIEQKNNELRLKTYTIYLRDSGDWCFASFKDEDTTGKTLYNWGRIARNGRQIICWAPDKDKFKALVSSGKLPGKIDKEDVTLGDLDSRRMELITSGSNGVLFRWDDPMVLTKLSK